jgi:cell division septal protein FtsQ
LILLKQSTTKEVGENSRAFESVPLRKLIVLVSSTVLGTLVLIAAMRSPIVNLGVTGNDERTPPDFLAILIVFESLTSEMCKHAKN